MIANAEMAQGTAERRAWARQRCSLPMTVKTVEQVGSSRWPAQSRDLSAGGLGMVLERRFEPATMVAATLEQPDAPLTVLARVVRVVPVQEGGWLLGCQIPFPIDGEELSHLLAGQPTLETAATALPARPASTLSLRERLMERLGWKTTPNEPM